LVLHFSRGDLSYLYVGHTLISCFISPNFYIEVTLVIYCVVDGRCWWHCSKTKSVFLSVISRNVHL